MQGGRKEPAGLDREAATAVGIEALGFLASDETLMARFLALSGIDPMAIRERARDPAFFAGLLDFLLADERSLAAFCLASGVPAERVNAAREALGTSFAARPR